MQVYQVALQETALIQQNSSCFGANRWVSEPSLISHRGAVRYMCTVLSLNFITLLCFSEHLHQVSPSTTFLVRSGLWRVAATHTHDTQLTGGCCCWTALTNTGWCASSASKLSKSRGSGAAFASTIFHKSTDVLLLISVHIQKSFTQSFGHNALIK